MNAYLTALSLDFNDDKMKKTWKLHLIDSYTNELLYGRYFYHNNNNFLKKKNCICHLYYWEIHSETD